MNMTRLRNRAAIAILVAVGALSASACAKGAGEAKKQSYEFTTIGRGSIESVVSSSGTLAVVNSVSVLAQMNGRIETLNVDYNDQGKEGGSPRHDQHGPPQAERAAGPGRGRQGRGQLRTSASRRQERPDPRGQGPPVGLRPQDERSHPRRREGGFGVGQCLARADTDPDRPVRDHQLADRRDSAPARYRRGAERGRRSERHVHRPLHAYRRSIEDADRRPSRRARHQRHLGRTGRPFLGRGLPERDLHGDGQGRSASCRRRRTTSSTTT